ncbi:MAG: hypothetical protein IPK87_14895 [Planctomycetes bacterium]|nr:hypothetical protein [Planctomycetota bacterium]
MHSRQGAKALRTANGLIHEGPLRTTKNRLAPWRLGVRLLIVVALCAAIATAAVAQDDKPPRKFTFGLMGVAMRADLTVYQGGARDADGNIVIKEKDKLQKWNGKELKTLDDFCRALYATKPGELVEVEISSPGDGEKRLVTTVKVKLGDPKAAYKELYTHIDKRKRTYDWRKNDAVTKGGPLREKLLPLLKEHKLEQPWDSLTAAHERELDLWDSYENLSSTDLLLSDPLASHQWIADCGNTASAGAYRTALLNLLDREPVEPTAIELPEKPAQDTQDAKSAWLAKVMELLLGKLDVAGTDNPGNSLAESRKELLDVRFAWRGEAGFETTARHVDLMRNLKLDLASTLTASREVLLMMSRLLESLWPDRGGNADAWPAPDGVKMADFVQGDALCFSTRYGLVAVGGPQRNVWKGGPASPCVIFDVGGDDEYLDCGTTRHGAAVSIVYDKTGNDRYAATGKWGVASGLLGFALVVDETGDDTYASGDWGIGVAFGGIGLLVDIAGNDRYLGGTNSIGCAAWGIGGVIDMAGNDVYDSHVYSVGCGQPGGVGLVLDFTGDDRYRCTGEQASAYGTEGEWMGGGIGCGFGWRTLACGGVGLVVDVKGNDIYDAGEFGLACGYFMAVGAVRDMEGDDIYHSSRYGLAAAAHAAVGVFMDDKGNDVYEGKTAASIGGVWDIATGYFYDGAGNDVYRCDGLGLGAAAQNAFGMFWDAGGDDVYRSGSGDFQHGARTIGEVGGFEYAGGRLARNFGIFIDSGGTDSYPRDNRKNGTTVVENEYAIFRDE